MKTEKLIIPAQVCPVCKAKFNRASQVVVVDNKTIVHPKWNCFVKYFNAEQEKLPEDKRGDRFGKYDADLRFTKEYEKSDKAITENEFKNYKKQFAHVFLMTERISVKKVIRERIWNSVGKKYARQLQFLHALARIYEKKKDTWRSNFKLTFVPSVLNQFKTKGYLSQKQWDLVESLIYQEIDNTDREYLNRSIENVRDVENLVLPDRLRYWQRRKSFFKWYNQKNDIPEEE